jgi:transcriptional regulator with XRE-family HTH domain
VDDTRSQAEPTDAQSSQEVATEEALSRAVGKELRWVREALGWSRLQFVARLPSGICDRTLLAYEHGKRHMTLLRLLELCRALGVAAPTLLTQALQRARLELANLVLQVDLQELIRDESPAFRPMMRWARNKLNRYPDGIVELPPSSVEELADFLGYPYQDLAKYLARFTPETDVVNGIDQAETRDADRERR